MKVSVVLALFPALAVAQSAAAPSANSPSVKPTDPLAQFSTSLEVLARRVHPAVAQIFSSGYRLSDDDSTGSSAAVVTRQRATGSGIILSADGYIVRGAEGYFAAATSTTAFQTNSTKG